MRKAWLVLMGLIPLGVQARPLTVTCDRSSQVAWRSLEGDRSWHAGSSADGRRWSLEVPFVEVEVQARDDRGWLESWSDTQRVGTTRAVVQLQLQRSFRFDRLAALVVLPLGLLLTLRWRKERRTRLQLQDTLSQQNQGRDVLDGLSERGIQLGGYRIGAQVGRGGMGVVYRGTRESDGQEAAVKVIHLDQGDEVFRARFARECSVASRLHHPSVVAVYDYGDSDKLLYLIMEWIDGSTLGSRLRAGALSLQQALPWMVSLTDAVHYCHQQGVVHCDLKPENIMLDSRNRLKVLDFGLARDPDRTRLTPIGSVLGTPTYLAPERYRQPEEKPDAKVDQYALGVIFYEMLAGKVPFFSRDVSDLGRLHLRGAVPPLIEARPELPGWICQMIHRMLGKNPQERYPDVAAVRAVLEQVHPDEGREEETVDLTAATGDAAEPPCGNSQIG